jgi:endonuclease/exonuclease/phosphatase family metal-dependent hydrolase
METVQWSRWRIDQAQAIVEDSLLYPDMAVVIAGDMNSAPFWQRWHLEKKFSDWGFGNFSKSIGHTMCKGPICMKIDLTFARLAKLNVIARLKERYSDHFPVFFQFTY